MKRPRAPIACFRCHHKKVRCDGGHPFCTRCQNTGSVCSYPSSRRSRNTQSSLVDPYIDHLSQLEHYIRQIESEMNEYRNMLVMSISNNNNNENSNENEKTSSFPQQDYLKKQLQKTEQEVQESRAILAQLRLRGEQRIARLKRNQAKESKQQKESPSTTINNTKITKNTNTTNNKNTKTIKNGHPSNINNKSASPSMMDKKNISSTIKSNDLVHYDDLFLSTSHIHSVNETAHLYDQHHLPPTSLSSPSHENMIIYPTSNPTLSMNPLINLHHHQQQQQSSNTITTPTPIISDSISTNSHLYYSSLNMMDFPWTTPTDYDHQHHQHRHHHDKNNSNHNSHKKNIKDPSTSFINSNNNNNRFEYQIEELNIRENEHYSSSTVATIEEAARLAQLHQLLQTNSPSSSSQSFHMNPQN
ncbi:unnamed protein product [Cunninghamella blakesleeana]